MLKRCVGMCIVLVCLLMGGRARAEGEGGAGTVLDYQRERILLNGRWEAVAEQEEQAVWKPEVAAGMKWGEMVVPGDFNVDVGTEAKGARSFWARKVFVVTGEQAGRSALLTFGGIRFGAVLWLNGKEIGRQATMGPFTLEVPAGLVRAGENTLVVKVTGWAGIARSASGNPLIPTGQGVEGWGRKAAGIYDNVALEFYDGVYLRRVLAVPDVKGGKVTLRCGFGGIGAMPGEVDVLVQVREAEGKDIYAGWGTLKTAQAGAVEVALKDVRVWTPGSPRMYEARVTVKVGEKVCDGVTFGFGMREFGVEGGHFRMNGEAVFLRGSELVTEWLWPAINREPKRYLIDEARGMNLNCFRTHTLPPPTSWLDIADRNGMMILAEMPVLYNYRDFKFTEAEREVWHKNVLADSANWIAKNWNHPSIVVWVLSNESMRDNAWESGEYWKMVRTLDPTRPTMRTGEPEMATGEIVDIHTCNNYTAPAEGTELMSYAAMAGKRDGKRALSNSEYMNLFGDVSAQWLGKKGHPDMPLNFAEFATEYTEAMRRLGYDCMLPYMYAGWPRFRSNNWRADYPTPMAAALHSSMAPVCASLDLFDRNFGAGQEVATPLHLINELPGDVAVKVQLYVTVGNPLFVPDEAVLKAAVWTEGFEATLKGGATAIREVKWQVPAKEGNYYLAAVLTRAGDRAVVSQRVVRAVGPAAVGEGGKIAVIGGTEGLRAWLKGRGMTVAALGEAGVQTVLVCEDAGAGSWAERAPKLVEFAKGGGRVVVLARDRELLDKLGEMELGKLEGSRAFAYEGVTRRELKGIDGEWWKRWNGLPGTVARGFIKGATLPEGSVKVLWSQAPDKVVVAAIPSGKGEIVVCLLALEGRVGKDGRVTDPVAERVLVNLVSGQ